MTDLPDGWAWAELGELGNWYGGATPSKREPRFWADGTVPWLSPKDMGPDTLAETQDKIASGALQESPVRLVPEGSVAVVVRSGILVRTMPVAFVPFATALNQDMKAISPHAGIDARWLAMGLRAFEPEILRDTRKSGTTVASLEVSRLLHFKLPVPPSAEQQRIVTAVDSYLSRLDSGLVSAARAGRLCASLAQRLVDAELERLMHCRTVPLGQLVREPLRNGHSARATDRPDGVRTLTLTAVTRGIFNERYTKMTSADQGRVKDLWLRRGDILIERSNTEDLVGISAMYDGPSDWAIYPDLLIRVRVNDRMLPEYVSMVLSASRIRDYYRHSARGLAGSMPKIDQGVIERTQVPVLSREEQKRIVTDITRWREEISRMSEAVHSSESHGRHLRSALLSSAFSGALLPQDSADEPATVLLERIRAASPRDARKRPKQSGVEGGLIRERGIGGI